MMNPAFADSVESDNTIKNIEKYLNNDENFENLINTYTGYRGDEGLQNLILNIYRFIQSSKNTI